MNAIERALWHVEAHLFKPFALEELATAAGVSKFHLSRLFSFALGAPPSAYARMRRLTEGARRLADGEGDILNLALELGYSSHEAFTRAFRDQFGQTPEQVRKSGSLATLSLVEAKTVNTFSPIKLAPPSIETKPAILLAGLARSFKFSERGAIPNIWMKFGPQIPGMPNRKGQHTFGVCTGDDPDADGFDYLAAVEVSSLNDLPEGIKGQRIGPRRYAVYRHGGHVAEMGAACNAAFEDLAARKDIRFAEDGLALMEHYPPSFNPMTGAGGYEIWLPVKQ